MHKIRTEKHLVNKFITKVCQIEQQIQYPKKIGRYSKSEIVILGAVPQELFSQYCTLWDLQGDNAAMWMQ
jgi:hypothetical protein